ncbi:MAG: glutamate-5-semialdehyde dehydrogenase [Candidatus Binatia bacterium]|nr:glutamate-5-semialdehyde dehydrogenase [Candidatus Binatia bacterium]MDG1959805.1 glutamate-5-semialdehyde dehydrogenase [Candidatus Binatia bacterium]MDG2010134.1 glutamate-5-semialdehyde dehydrogenase [Candidatus Binatia bacterium]
MAELQQLEKVTAGERLLVGGDRFATISEELAAAFQPGDSILVVESSGEVLHLPQAERAIADNAVQRARNAFAQMGTITDERITAFFEEFANRLEDPAVWERVLKVNARDLERAQQRGRSTTRLIADDKLRQGMIEGLRGWCHATSRRGTILETIEHEGWNVDLVGAELGVVGFVFEGRPNVLADATGVLRSGNTVVFRIGSDALQTAQCLMSEALSPALLASGLPEGAVVLIESAAHAAGWALFSNRDVSLAVARGSGPAVATLGSLARQAGVPASLHGTGGAWIVGSKTATPTSFAAAIEASLDRKVCNTLNVCCIPENCIPDLLPCFLEALERAGSARDQSFKLHVVAGDEKWLPAEMLTRKISVRRATGDQTESQIEALPEASIGHEWEWEETPEVTLKIVSGLPHAIELFNRHSPQFVASLISEEPAEHARFFQSINAPFVGNGFTRWVDGQYALNQPELGLSNWENGRLLGRAAVLSGDSVYTVRARVTQRDPNLRR